MLTRHSDNPILTHRQCALPATTVFNAGVVKWQGRSAMLFLNDP